MGEESMMDEDGGAHHIKTSPLICGTNQWAGFYTTGPPTWKSSCFVACMNSLKYIP